MKIRLLKLLNDIFIAYTNSDLEFSLLYPISLPFVINYYQERLISLDSYLPISSSFFETDTLIYVTFPILLTPNQFLTITPNITPLHMVQYTFFYEATLPQYSELLANNLTLSHVWYLNPDNFSSILTPESEISQEISEFLESLTFTVVNGNNNVVLTLAEFFNTATPLW